MELFGQMKDLKEYIQPLKDSFLHGKRKPYERPQFKLRKLPDMLRDLRQIDLLEWVNYAYSQEPLNGRLTQEQRVEWMQEAIECGKEYAKKLAEKYETTNPTVIAKELGLDVQYPTFPEKTDRVLFAEYRLPNRIWIYMDGVDKTNDLLKDNKVAHHLSYNLDVKNTILAHEIFHHIEEVHSKEIYTKTKKIRLWGVGPIANNSTLMALSEIAAMAFAMELTKMPFVIWIMDVLMVYGYSPMEASGLYEEMMNYAGHEIPA